MSIISGYPQKIAASVTGITPNTLSVYVRDGIIIPSVRIGKGRGQAHLFSAADLVHIRIVSMLVDRNYSRDILKSLCNFLQRRTIWEGKKMLWLDAILDPSRMKDRDTCVITFGNKTWSYSEGASSMEMMPDGTVICPLSVAEVLKKDTNVTLIDINAVKREIVARL